MKYRMMIILFFIFLLIRVLFIRNLPIFNDESIFLYWGSLFAQNFKYWNLPLIIDGKEPGYTILLGLFLKLPFDAFLIGRFLSVSFAALTFIILLKISQTMFSKRSLPLIALFAIINPFLLIFDRLALAESLIALIVTASFYAYIKLKNNPNRNQALLLGSLLGLGWWVKSTLFLVLPALIFDAVITIKTKGGKKITLYYVLTLFVFLIFVVSLTLYRVINSLSNITLEKTMSFPEIISTPFMMWINNLTTIMQIFTAYLTPLGVLLFLIGIMFALKNKQHRLLIMWILIPIAILCLIGKGITSRYMFPIIPLTTLIIYYGYSKLDFYRKVILIFFAFSASIVCLLLILFPLVFYTHYLRFFPQTQKDFSQYVKTWSSGYGVQEAANWIKQNSGSKPTLVLVRPDFGNPESAMFILLRSNKNIRVLPLNAVPKLTPQELSQLNILFVSRGVQFAGLEKIMQQKIIFKKPLDDEFVGIYSLGL